VDFDFAAITEETLDAAKKATSGILTTTGIQGIDLSGLVSLVPVNTPFRNSLSRVTPATGAKVAQWKALLNINSSQPNAAVALDYAGSLTQFSEQDVFSPYAALELVARITQDSVDIARSYADALAIGTLQNLNQVMISEDINLINATAYALPTIGTPTVVQSDTGGTIAASTAVNVKVAARSGNNYFYGGSGVASAQGTVTTSSVVAATHSATATVAAVTGAVAYDWYVGGFYYTTTVVNKVTITAIPTAAQAIPTTLPLLSTTAPTTPPTGDTSFDTKWMNGAIAGIVGDYGTTGLVTPGSGTGSGAYIKSLDGATLTSTGEGIAELDAANLALWNTLHLSPTAYMMNAQQATDITNKLLATNQAFIMIPPTDGDARANLAAGGYVNRYLNKATGGTPIAIEVHPHMAPGTIIVRTDRVPFPGANIDAVFTVRTLRDYFAYEYAPSLIANTAGGGPRHDVAVRSLETLVNRAPVANGVISNIQAG
jgi:hypothetical protein